MTCERRDAGGWRRLVEGVTFEARGGDLVGIMTTAGEWKLEMKLLVRWDMRPFNLACFGLYDQQSRRYYKYVVLPHFQSSG